MEDNRKKTLLWVVFILLIVVSILIVLLYSWFGGSSTNTGPSNVNSNQNPFGGLVPKDNTANSNNANNTNSNQQSYSSTTPNIDQSTGKPVVIRLKKIYDKPVSGIGIVDTKDRSGIEFVDRASGHIIFIDPKNPSIQTIISNTTMPKSEESFITHSGNASIMRFLSDDAETIKTFGASVSKSTSTGAMGVLKGAYWENNINTLAVSPSSEKAFYYTENTDGSKGFIVNYDGSGKTLVLDNPIREWLADWPNESTIALNTKPSYIAPGFLFFLNAKTGSLSPIIENINGLTTLVNSNLSKILIGQSSSGIYNLSIYDTKLKTQSYVSSFTFPEKCTWSSVSLDTIYCAVPENFPYGNYPDDWYIGNTSFVDDIFKVNLKTATSSLFSNLKAEGGEEIDVINPKLYKKDQSLFFMNKKDYSVWELDLK